MINHSSKSKKEPIDHAPCSVTKEENTNVTQRASNNRDIIIISWYMLSSLKPMNSFSLNHSCVRVKHLGKKKKAKVKEPSNPSFSGSLQNNITTHLVQEKKTQQELKMIKPRLIVEQEKE